MAGEKFALSFGGGVNSMALAIWLLDRGHPIDFAVFADTGAEAPETYEYLDVATTYLASRGVSMHTVRRNGPDLYDTCLKRRVFPSAIWRWSTRDFKVRPIERFYKTMGKPIIQYLAIAFDELERMRDSRVGWIENRYPLVDARITRAGCVELIEKAGLPVPPKSGCWFCPFNNLERWQWLSGTHPDLYAKAVALEEQSKHFPSQRLTDQVFRNRAVVTLRQLPTLDRRDADHPQDVPCGAECFV